MLPPSSTLEIVKAGSSETLIIIYKTTRSHNLEDHNPKALDTCHSEDGDMDEDILLKWIGGVVDLVLIEI
jgi:hypothetical protein